MIPVWRLAWGAAAKLARHFENAQLPACGILCHLQWRIKAVRFCFARYFRNALWVCHGKPLSAIGAFPPLPSRCDGRSSFAILPPGFIPHAFCGLETSCASRQVVLPFPMYPVLAWRRTR